jgi:hypothetical protein
MADVARVESVDALRALKTALFKFADAANTAIDDADSEVQRTITWLETEQTTYWQGQIRKATEAVTRAKEAVRMKKLFKDATGRPGSAVDEEKALSLAIRRLDAAQEKLQNVRRWMGRLRKEVPGYRGQVQRLATSVQSGIPVAASHLDKLTRSLEAYINLAGPAAEVAAPAEASGGEESRPPQEQLPSMARGDGELPVAPKPKEPAPPEDEPKKP